MALLKAMKNKSNPSYWGKQMECLWSQVCHIMVGNKHHEYKKINRNAVVCNPNNRCSCYLNLYSCSKPETQCLFGISPKFQ